MLIAHMHHRALVWIRYKKSELVKGVHGSLGNRVKQLMLNGVDWAGEDLVGVRAQGRRNWSQSLLAPSKPPSVFLTELLLFLLQDLGQRSQGTINGNGRGSGAR